MNDAVNDTTLVWPATPLQQGFVALAHEGGDAPYTGQAVLRIHGPLNPALLHRAVIDLVAAEPQLHAGFVMDADVDPVQFVEPGTPPRYRTVVTGAEDFDGALATARRVDAGKPFDLADPPLVRWTHVATEGRSALVVTAHHAVLDAWSMPLLAGALARALAGEPVTASEVYPRHLGWLSSQDVAGAASFWSGHLAACVDRPGVPDGPVRGRLSARVDVAQEFLRTAGLTPADWARTAWGLALDVVTGGNGTPFAVPVSGRSPEVPGADRGIGLFTDSVLVADAVDPAATLLAVARAGADRWRNSLPHHHVGMRGILKALQSGELATALLTVENPKEFENVGITLESVEDDTHYPLALTVRPEGASWHLELDHRTDTGLSRSVLDAVCTFLTADPNAAVGEVPPSCRDTLARFGRGPRSGEAVPELLTERWRRVLGEFPERDLLVVAGPTGELSRQTGAELGTAVERLRTELLAQLPASGTAVVGVSVPRGRRSVEALLAVLSAGAAVLVLDPELPDLRRQEVLTTAGAVALITQVEVLALHDEPRGARIRVPGADDLAAVVLTSGSTGTPKPVAVPHRALAHLAARQLEDLHPTDPVQVAHTASFHFDAQWDAMLALFGGHTVHVLTEDLFLDPFALAEYVRGNTIAYLDLTPTVWSALLAAHAFTELPAVCVVGGEAFGGPLWTRMRELAATSGSRVFNLYGPTEATVDAFAAEVTDADHPVVGRPVGPTGALVLDEWLRPVPPGVDGELYLAGPQLAHGYLGQSGRTAERFVANPHPDVVRGDRLYRTGDRARWDASGRLLVQGRTDDQITLHGLRIEPGEIEQILLQHPAVSSAVVLAPEVGRTGKRLVAWVVSQNSSEELRTWCQDRLPSHLVPRDVVIMHEFPLTSNGKLDRARLPLPGQAETTERSSDDPALVAVREAVASVLGVPVGDQDDFFRLGGDSISAIQVTARLRAAGWTVRPSELLVARTPERIAVQAVPVASRDVVDTPLVTLTTAQRAELDDHVHTVLGVAVDRVWPLTPTQFGIHVDSQRSQPDPYRTTALLRVTGTVSADRVEAAVQGWFTRHPALRIGVWQGSLPEPVAFVPESLHIPFDVVESDDLEAVQRAELNRPADFGAARLAGATWIPGNPGHLVVSLHHLVADGWSLPILAGELEQELSGLTVTGVDDDVDEGFEHHLRTLSTTSAEAFWRRELEGARPTLLGAGRQADPTRIVRRETTVDLGDGVRELGTTTASLVQAAWAAVLAARTGRPDVAWALTSAGRSGDVPGIDRAVGMFVTTRPVRARIDGDLLRSVTDVTARSEEHAALGLGRIERLADGHAPLTDTLVVVENYPTPHRDRGRDIAVDLVEGRDATTFPVTVTAFPGDALRVEVEVDPELLGETAAIADELLAGCVAAVDALLRGERPDLSGIVRQVDGPVAPQHVPAVTSGSARADVIAAVVADVLGVPGGPGDDFFTLGGDSISAVRLVGALRARGVVVGIADVFAARTPAGLDAVATDHVVTHRPDGIPLLTPALAWFTALDATDAELRGFQQLRVVDLPAGTSVDEISAAATTVLARHDALRLVVGPDLRIAEPRAAVVSEGELHTELRRVCAQIDHTTGDLVRWVVVDGGSAEPRLAIAAHHVAVDAVSWGLVLDELRVLLDGGELPQAPSFTAWTHAQRAAVDNARTHLHAWSLEPTDDLVTMDGPLGRAGDARTHEVRLGTDRSREFLDLVARGWRPDALLAAALSANRGDLLVELEGHGRPTNLPTDDPRHGPSGEAVGWFTATWPVRIPSGARAAHRAVLASAALGADHGVLRYLDSEGLPSPEPQVLVNWLGRDVPAGSAHTPWRTSLDAAALEEDLGLHTALPVSHPLELNAWATETPEGPVVVARWQAAVEASHVVATWQQALEELLASRLGEPPTPVHDAVGLTSAELDALGDVRAVWPLSPVQRGMVFHAEEDTDHYTSYVELDLAGTLDPTRLRQALDAAVAAHPQLGARIARVGDTPVLVTVDTEVPWTLADTNDVEAHRTAELETSYDLAGPLLRARLLRTAPDRHTLILGTHHVLLDGWSVPLLVDELLGRYAGTWTAPAEDLVRGPFARSVAARGETGDAGERRRDLLARHPDALEPLLPELDDRPVQETERKLPDGLVAGAARELATTPAAVLTAAWTVVLGALSGRRVVSPGVVVSGRDTDTENLLGMFIDTVPLLLDLTQDPSQLVRDVADQTTRAAAEPAVGLATLSTSLGRAPWVDTLLVVENYPVGELPALDGLQVLDVTGRDGTHYGLALTAEENVLRLEHHPALFADAGAVLAALEDVLDGFTRSITVEPDLPRWESRERVRATRGPVEVVRAAFTDLFGRAVAADENFFALGGDSILAMSLVSHLRTAGWVARPSSVFTAPTPELLAGLVEPLEPLEPLEPQNPAAQAATIALDQRGNDALAALLRNL